MSVCLVGDRKQLRSLYGKMLRLQNRREPLVANGFYYPKRWLGNLVVRLRADWGEVYCKGRCVAPTKEAVYAAIDAFDEENDDMDAYINLKEFEVVTLSDML